MIVNIQNKILDSQKNILVENQPKHILKIKTAKNHILTGKETYQKVCGFCKNKFEKLKKLEGPQTKPEQLEFSSFF